MDRLRLRFYQVADHHDSDFSTDRPAVWHIGVQLCMHMATKWLISTGETFYG
jgi:hypothetical protein